MTTGVKPLEAVVLAAGSGSRFGGRKLTSPFRDGLLLDGALTAAFASPARSVTVVWGADGRVPGAASAAAARLVQSDRLTLVEAAAHDEGMAASLRAGIASLPADAGGVLVFLGDMPDVPRGIANDLALAIGGDILAAAPVRGDQRGHPVLFTAALFPALLALEGDEGASRVLAALGDRLALVETSDEGVLFDVDRPGPDQA